MMPKLAVFARRRSSAVTSDISLWKIFAAVAAGLYPDAASAVEALHAPIECVYTPNAASSAVYDALYAEYKTLHDYFGRGENGVMKRLRALAAKQRGT